MPDCLPDSPLAVDVIATVRRTEFPAAALAVQLVVGTTPGCRRMLDRGTMTVECPDCPGDPQTVFAMSAQVAPDAPAVAAVQWEVAQLSPLPTQVTVRWAMDGLPVPVAVTVPVSLMVENASSPSDPDGPTGSMAPFERPVAAKVSAGLAFELGTATGGVGMMGRMVRMTATVTNGGAVSAQVDRAQFHAVLDNRELKEVDNSTPRPLLSWAPGFFFCLRDLPGDVPFPDNTILEPGQRVSGLLCWIDPAGTWRSPPPVTIGYGRPETFRQTVVSAETFLGVYLPPDSPQ